MSLKVDIGFLFNLHEFYKSHKKVSKDREVRINIKKIYNIHFLTVSTVVYKLILKKKTLRYLQLIGFYSIQEMFKYILAGLIVVLKYASFSFSY